MKELLSAYAAYNHWAHARITEAILAMDEHLHQQIVQNSFPNLYATVLHMWDAESAWWQRVKRHESIVVPSKSFNPTMKEAVNGLLSQSAQWKDWLGEQDEALLHQSIPYRNLKGGAFSQPLFDILHHVFNHGTYHRGQLVSIMRELGEVDIPQTDFIVWTRLRG
jgi:uncharacterized damage-inducible protein DinB